LLFSSLGNLGKPLATIPLSGVIDNLPIDLPIPQTIPAGDGIALQIYAPPGNAPLALPPGGTTFWGYCKGELPRNNAPNGFAPNAVQTLSPLRPSP
jgi:hypothetical protein